VQVSFGGNAAGIQANAAEPLALFNEDDFLAQVRRIESRRVATRSRSHYNDLSAYRFHVLSSSASFGVDYERWQGQSMKNVPANPASLLHLRCYAATAF